MALAQRDIDLYACSRGMVDRFTLSSFLAHLVVVASATHPASEEVLLYIQPTPFGEPQGKPVSALTGSQPPS